MASEFVRRVRHVADINNFSKWGLEEGDIVITNDNKIYSLVGQDWQQLSPKYGSGGVGEQGLPGKDGKDGAQGLPGKDGKDGAQGLPGKDGKDGAQGLPGKDGKDGAQGLPGKDGKDGAQGLPGKDGSTSINPTVFNGSVYDLPEGWFINSGNSIKNTPNDDSWGLAHVIYVGDNKIIEYTKTNEKYPKKWACSYDGYLKKWGSWYLYTMGEVK